MSQERGNSEIPYQWGRINETLLFSALALGLVNHRVDTVLLRDLSHWEKKSAKTLIAISVASLIPWATPIVIWWVGAYVLVRRNSYKVFSTMYRMWRKENNEKRVH